MGTDCAVYKYICSGKSEHFSSMILQRISVALFSFPVSRYMVENRECMNYSNPEGFS